MLFERIMFRRIFYDATEFIYVLYKYSEKKYPSSIGVSSGARWTHRVRMQTSSMHFDIFWFAS